MLSWIVRLWCVGVWIKHKLKLMLSIYNFLFVCPAQYLWCIISIVLVFFQVTECEWASGRIGETISLDGESDQKISSSSVIPSDFFEDMESSWKGRVKRIHIEEELAQLQSAAEALSSAVGLENSNLLWLDNFMLYCDIQCFQADHNFSFAFSCVQSILIC